MDLPAGKGLSGLRKLRVLRLDHNHLEWVRAAEIVPLVSLLQLDLSYNRLTAVEGLNSLTGLEELRLASNHLPKLPNISRCQKVYRPHPPPANRVLMHCSSHCVCTATRVGHLLQFIGCALPQYTGRSRGTQGTFALCVVRDQ